MFLSVLLSGFILGAAGSLHCVGMCGPLSLALPTAHLSGSARFFSLLIYQVGRVITYSVIGLVTGLAGRSIYTTGLQQYFSIILGLLIFSLAVVYFIQKRGIAVIQFTRPYRYISRMMGLLLRQKTGVAGFLLLGMANGLLPCGMVYIALLATLSFSQVIDSVSFMAMFGAGTLPAMIITAYALQKLKWETRLTFRKLVPFFIGMVGLLLVLRGLNIGLPFISPALAGKTGKAVVCHP